MLLRRICDCYKNWILMDKVFVQLYSCEGKVVGDEEERKIVLDFCPANKYLGWNLDLLSEILIRG